MTNESSNQYAYGCALLEIDGLIGTTDPEAANACAD